MIKNNVKLFFAGIPKSISGQLTACRLFCSFFVVLLFTASPGSSQVTVLYPQQTGNYYSSFLDGGFNFNQGTFQVAMQAKAAAPKQTVLWRKFRTNGSGANTSDRSLQIGDQFVVRLSATRAYGRIGFALLASPATGSYANRESNYALSVNLDGPLYLGAGSWGNWYIKYAGGAAVAAGFGGQQVTYKDFVFTLTLTAADRMNVTMTDGTTTNNFYDLQLNTSSPITDYSIFLEDDYDGDNNRNVYWGLPVAGLSHSVTNAGSLPIGQSNNSFTIASVIHNGLDANSASLNNLDNALVKPGTGTLTLSGVNTYQGITAVTGGTLSTTLLADGGTASGIGQSSNAATSLLLGNGTSFMYTGAAVNTDRLFTINGTAAAHSATINASGTGALNFTNTGSIEYGTPDQTRTLQLSGTNTGNNTLAALVADNGTGAAGLTKTGAGTWSLTGTNTYSGITTINAGVLSAASITNGGVASSIGQATNAAANLVLGGGTLRYTGATTSTDRGFTLTAATNSSIDISNAASTLTISGSVPNTTGAFTKAGAGNLILSGTNLFTGGVNVNAGTLTAGSAGALNAATPNAVTMGGGTLSLNGFNITVSALSGASGTINNDNATPATLTVNTTATSTYSGAIANGTGGALGLTKSGTGDLTLSGTNTYSGTTTVTAGTLTVGAAGGLSPNSNIVFNGGNLSVGAVGTSAVINGGTINFQTNTSINLGTGATTFSLNFANSSAEVWNGAATVTIYNWTPSAGKTINVAGAGLTAAQLAKINFDNYGVGAKIVGTQVLPAFLYITQPTGSGNYTVAGSWLLGDKPVLNDGTESIYIQPGFTLNMDAAAPTVKVLRAEVGGILVMNAGDSVQVFATGDFRIAGSVTMTSTSVIEMNAGISMIAQSATASFSPAGILNFLGAFTITSNTPNAVLLPNVNLKAAVDFGQNSTIQNGSSLNMTTGGFVSVNAPYYAAGSTLKFNTGGNYGRNLEWSATTGRGYPYNVLITNNTILDLGAWGGAATARQCAGSLTIDAGSVLTMNQGGTSMSAALTVLQDVNVAGELRLGGAAGGDIKLGGNYTFAATGTVLNNGRAVFFNGASGDQLIARTGGGTVDFDYLIIDKPAGNVKMTTGTNGRIISTVNNNTGLRVLQLLNGDFDMNDGTFTLEGDNQNSMNVLVANGIRKIFTSTGTGEFKITGSNTAGISKFNVIAQAGGTLLFDNDVVVSTVVGVNFGAAGITTVNAILRIDQYGYVITYSPNYGPASTLVYNNGAAGYNRNMEWNTNTFGALGTGYPNNVIVQNNTPVDLNSATYPATFALGCSGKMRIEPGSSVITGAMAHTLSVGDSMIIGGTLSLSTNGAGNLFVGGSWNRTGNFVQNDRMVTFDSTNTASIKALGGQTFSRMTINKKTAASVVTIDSSVAITNELFLQRGAVTLNNNVTIRSTGTRTARIGETTTPANIPLTYSTGKFIIERNVDALRSWRLLSVPVVTSQTVNAAWMEGATPSTTTPTVTNNDPVPGYGTHISGPQPATNGFDETPLNNYSIKYYNGTGWVGTGIQPGSTSINSYPGWMLFVRGPRSYPINITTSGTTPQTTTLQTKGQIYTGTQPTINPSGFTVVGNPYASAVNFSNITKSGPGDIYYIWDPRLATNSSGTSVGGWVTMTRSTGNTYTASPTPLTAAIDLTTGRIESGAAIVVNSTNISSLNFKEADKSAQNALVFRPHTAPVSPIRSLRVNLYVKNSDNSLSLFDGILHLFNRSYNNKVDGADALKLKNFSEIISIASQDSLLSIEKRNMLSAGDTIQYNIKQLRVKNYTLEFIADKIAPNNLSGYIEDRFLQTFTPLNMNGTTKVDFTVSAADTGSYTASRFRVVFRRPVKYVQVKASSLDNRIAVDWKVEDENNIVSYEIERSVDTENFSAVGKRVSTSGKTEGIHSYDWFDESPLPGVYYYRIKSMGRDGIAGYSDHVKAELIKAAPGIAVFPNPVSGNTVYLRMPRMPQGIYSASLMNEQGQLIETKIVRHIERVAQDPVHFSRKVLPGNYQLVITSPGKKRMTLTVSFQ